MVFDAKPVSGKPPPYEDGQRLGQLLEIATQQGRDVSELRSRVQTLYTYLTPSEGSIRKAQTARDLFDDVRMSFDRATIARQFGIAEEEFTAFKDFEEEIKEAVICDCEAPEPEGEPHSPVARVAGAAAMGVGAVVVAPIAIAAGIAGAAVFTAGTIVTSIGDGLLNVFKQGVQRSGAMGSQAAGFASGTSKREKTRPQGQEDAGPPRRN